MTLDTACRMRHDVLDACAQGMLNGAQRDSVAAHAAECASCSAVLRQLEQEGEVLGAMLRRVDAPPMRQSAQALVARYSSTEPERIDLPATQRVPILVGDPVPPEIRSVWRAARWSWVAHPLRLAALAALVLACGAGWVWVRSAQDEQREAADRVEARLQSQDRQRAELLEMQRRNLEALAENAREMRQDLSKKLELLGRNLEQERQAEGTRIAESLAGLQSELQRLQTRIKADELASAEEQRKALAEERGRLHGSLQDQRRDLQAAAEKIEELNKRLGTLQTPPAEAPKNKTDAALRLGADRASLLDLGPANKSTQAMPLRLQGRELGWARYLMDGPIQVVVAGNSATQADRELERVRAINLLQAAAGRAPSFAGPAAKDGRVFVGNGWSATRMLAFDGANGKALWSFNANDNGAGPPVLTEDGEIVTFATESCSVYSLNVKTGVKLWSRWVGDPAMTQPAVTKDRVYLVHANGRGKGVGDGNAPYILSSLNLTGGATIWSKPLQADAVTSPVIEGKRLYLATQDGMLAAHALDTGQQLWSQKLNATSAPTVAGGRVFFSSWNASRAFGFEETLSSFALGENALPLRPERLLGPYPAAYLMPIAVDEKVFAAFDSSYDEEGAENAEARLLKEALSKAPSPTPAFAHVWAHMGARPTIVGRECFVVLGDRIVDSDVNTGRIYWEYKVSGDAAGEAFSLNRGQPALTPPAYADGKLYVGSAWGDLLCLDGGTGKLLWRYRVPGSQGIVSQVVLDHGRAYATTQSGMLVCLETGDAKATGWPMWGGSPGHNGLVVPPEKELRLPARDQGFKW